MPSPKNPRRCNKEHKPPVVQKHCTDMRKRAGSQHGFDVTKPLFSKTNQQTAVHYPTSPTNSVNLSSRTYTSQKNEILNQERRSADYAIPSSTTQSPLRHYSTRVHSGSFNDTVPTLMNYKTISEIDDLHPTSLVGKDLASEKSSATALLPQNLVGDLFSNQLNNSNLKRRRPTSSSTHSNQHVNEQAISSADLPLRPPFATPAFQQLSTSSTPPTQQANQGQTSSASIPPHNILSLSPSIDRNGKKNSFHNDTKQDGQTVEQSNKGSASLKQSVIDKPQASSGPTNENSMLSHYTTQPSEQQQKPN